MRRQRLSRVTPGGQVEIIGELGGGPNGAALGPDGRIYVTNNGGPGWIVGAQGNSLPGGQAADNHGGGGHPGGPAGAGRGGRVEPRHRPAGARPPPPRPWRTRPDRGLV